jgi:hypothetical protein
MEKKKIKPNLIFKSSDYLKIQIQYANATAT